MPKVANKTITAKQLRPGMILEEEICNGAGVQVAPKWIRLTESMVDRLERILDRMDYDRSLTVIDPTDSVRGFLVVDDDPVARKILTDWLQPVGPCSEASNGSEALEILEQHATEANPFDVILLDVMMPDLNGHTVLQRFRELEKANGVNPKERTRVIMVSALSDRENVDEAFKEEADGYLTKPADRMALMTHLKLMEVLR